MKTSSQNFEKIIEKFSRELGFDLVGFSPAKIDKKYQDAFRDWLDNNREGEMSYMQKIEQRFDLQKVLPGARTVIVLGTNYYREQAPLKRGHGRVARYAYGRDYHKVIGKRLKRLEKFIKELVAKSQHATQPATLQSTVVNRPQSTPSQLTKSYVDTGPLLERVLAEQAGIGRIGKNGCVISKEFGSWILLSEVVITMELTSEAKSIIGDTFDKTNSIPGNGKKRSATPEAGTAGMGVSGRPELEVVFSARRKLLEVIPAVPAPGVADRWSNPAEKSFNVCGNCTRCIDACPTGAIIAPGVVDSRLCISYLTIEHKGKLDPKLEKIIKKTKRVFGCDICQEVCPHNHARQRICSQEHNDQSSFSPVTGEPNEKSACAQGRLRPAQTAERSEATLFHPPIAGDQLNLSKIRKITSREAYIKAFAGSPLMRAKYIKSYTD